MFKNIVDFSYKRTVKEAVGFYLACLLLNILIGGVLGGLFSNDFSSGLDIGKYGAVITQLVIGILILSKRKLYKNFFYIILIILTVNLSYWGGALLGLIPLAYITTKKSQ